MTELLIKMTGNEYFISIGIPIITALLTIFIKIVSRNDKYSAYKKEDFAIGLELGLVAIIILISNFGIEVNGNPESEKLTDRLTIFPWILITLFIGLWIVSTMVRKFGWNDENNLNLWMGIIIPNVLGLIYLVSIVMWLNQTL